MWEDLLWGGRPPFIGIKQLRTLKLGELGVTDWDAEPGDKDGTWKSSLVLYSLIEITLRKGAAERRRLHWEVQALRLHPLHEFIHSPPSTGEYLLPHNSLLLGLWPALECIVKTFRDSCLYSGLLGGK